MTPVSRLTASVALMLAVTWPAYAGQGKSQAHKSTAPSATGLPSSAVTAPPTAASVPFAWIDDASVLPAGAMSVSLSTLIWRGADLNEVDLPVMGAALGLGKRVQVGTSVPLVQGDAASGVVGGVGTAFVSAKVGVLTGETTGVKLAVAPTLEFYGDAAQSALAPSQSRTQFGLPVSVEVTRNGTRLFASAGAFTTGSRFAGGGIGKHLTARTAVSAAFSRAWTGDQPGIVARDRKEISGSAAFSPTSQVAVFGSIGRSIATTDADGAGTTVSLGLLFLIGSISAR